MLATLDQRQETLTNLEKKQKEDAFFLTHSSLI